MLFINTVNSYVYIVLGTDELMSKEHWWNDTDKGKLKYSDKNPSQCHAVHHKSHMAWLGIQPGPPRKRQAPNNLHHGIGSKPVCFWCRIKLTDLYVNNVWGLHSSSILAHAV
jgi:hypothetical protein